MPLHGLANTRLSLLRCDDCDSVMTRDGSTAAKRFAESDPSDLAPHYAASDELRAAAESAGWKEERERWSCPRCSKPPAT